MFFNPRVKELRRRFVALHGTLLLALTIACSMVGPAFALSTGGPGGKWPESWPKELEPLRDQAWTWHDGLIAITNYDIAFKSREQFEAAWPHIVKLQSQGASITLMRGPHVRVYKDKDGSKGRVSGVRITPPLDGKHSGKYGQTRITLVVDGKIVDLNRIRLPVDTPIIDRRFEK